MRFLIDCQLPPGFAARLRAAGFHAVHASDVGLVGQADHVIWHYADQEACCIITKDQDFAHMVQTTTVGPAVVWIRFGNTRNDTLWARVGPRMTQIVTLIQAGERLIELR